MEDIGDQEKKRGDQKERDKSSHQSIPYVLFTVWNTQRGSWSYIKKRRGREEIEEEIQEEKRGSQTERDRSSQ